MLEWKRRRANALVLGAVCFGLFVVQLDLTIVNVALRVIQSDLRASIAELQWVVGAYALVLAGLMLTAGDLADRCGRKRVFLAGLALFAVGSSVCALATDIGALVAARVIQGVGAAALLPASLAVLTHAFPEPAERARAIGVWAGVSGLSLIAGPVAGGLLVDGLGWRSIFWVSAAIGTIAFLFAGRYVPESARPSGQSLDVPGQVLGIISLFALVFLLIQGHASAWASLVVVPALLTTVVAGGAFVLVERWRRNPMLDLTLFRTPAFSAANAASGLMNLGMLGMLFAFSLFLQRVQGYSPLGTGARLLPVFIPLVALAPVFGYVVGRIGARLPAGVGLIVSGVGLVALRVFGTERSYGLTWAPLGLIGLGLGVATPALVTAAVSAVPADRAGLASAVNNTCRQAGGAIGVALIGSVVDVDLATGIRVALLIAAGALLAGGFVGLALLPAAKPAAGLSPAAVAGSASTDR